MAAGFRGPIQGGICNGRQPRLYHPYEFSAPSARPDPTQARSQSAQRHALDRSANGGRKGPRRAQSIKHGFFVGPEKWTPGELRDFTQTLDGLRDEFRPQGIVEEGCVTTMAQSYVRMAAMLRYENIAALKHHQQRELELNQRIAVADAPEATRLEAERAQLIAAGLWRPTIPGPREARAIIRYSGSLDRALRRASSSCEACNG